MSSIKNDSKCVHAGMKDYEYGPAVPPIYQTSTFKFKNVSHGAALFKGDEQGYIYTRMGNPTIEALESALAELESGSKALGCSSGMAAVNTVFSGLLSSGDHVICSKSVYGPTSTSLINIYSKFGIEASFVETSDFDLIQEAVKENTKMIYIESPGNPTIAITDLEKVGGLCKSINAYFVIDNTFMSPLLQQPILYGADVIVHSMTKFLNGHADVVAGAIIVNNDELYTILKKTLNQLGGVIDPFNSFLVHRGLRTLSVRMEKHCANAQKVAEFLEAHNSVEWVRYPGLKSHPQHELAKKQMSGFGGVLSFGLKGGFAAGEKMMNQVKFCLLAVSLGGVETLIQHPASMTHASMGKEARESAGISDGLVRLSVGIENSEDIIEDLNSALSV